jgi:hypothetical protein
MGIGLASPNHCHPERSEGSRFVTARAKTQIPRRSAPRNDK